ncbi:P-loop containing nucleoside triphosphate hydrolase protein [Scenedesmus sp. NREL 46B-D3]|nr:P-loop containing nucleoside triphosphate hydrolase protein [Scenedesmus sp. NREL 46B-D3]
MASQDDFDDIVTAAAAAAKAAAAAAKAAAAAAKAAAAAATAERRPALEHVLQPGSLTRQQLHGLGQQALAAKNSTATAAATTAQQLDERQHSGCDTRQPAAGTGTSVAAGAAPASGTLGAPAAVSGGVCPPAAAAASGGANALAAAASGAACPPAAASGGGPAASGGPPVGCGPIVCSAKLALGPQGMVEASFTSWHEQLVTACLSIPGARRADSHGAAWCKRFLLPADKVPQLERLLKELTAIRVTSVEPLPDLVLKVLAAHRRQPDDSALYEALGRLQLAPGESLEQRMMPFQRQGVQFGLRVGGRLLLGDEMGLGKTVQACALAKCYQAEWPVLVVTPSSLRLSWAAALYDWLRVTDDRVLVVLKRSDMQRLAEAPSQAAARAMYDFVVLSYDLLKDVASLLEGLAFQVVILDESHCIKNPKAGRTQNTLPLLKKAKRAILLSGTPALNRPTELLTQLQGLLPKAAITKAAFEGRYAKIVDCGRFKKNDGSQNEEELNRLLVSTVMIRRRKAEVLKDLPAKLRKQVWLMLSGSERKQLTKLKQDLQEVRQMTTDMYGLGQQAVGGSLLQGMQQEQRNKVMALYHETATVKASAVAAYVADLVVEMSDRQDKFLVFAYHRELMDAIQKGVCDVIHKNKEFRDLKYMRIDGSTPPKQREANVNQFQQDDNCRVAILNIKAAGVGLTLTRASTVVFAELAWTPSEVQQAEDRAHRIGQTSCVSVQLLLVKDSIDEVMWEMLQSKLASTGQVLDGQVERMEVDKSSAAHRSKAGLGWQEDGETQPDNQKSIKSFFGPSEGKDAAKKQRRT